MRQTLIELEMNEVKQNPSFIMDEISFFENSSVMVTQSLFFVGHRMVEIKNIASVKVEAIGSFLTIQVILMITGFLLMFFDGGRIFGLILFCITFLFVNFTEEKFSVHISTEQGEADCLVSKDKQYIEQVVKAINAAMWAYYSDVAPM
jgi:hypothetical protein